MWYDAKIDKICKSKYNTRIFIGEYVMVEKETYMRRALTEAKKAYEKDEIPVGAVVVKKRNNNCKSS